MLEDLTSTVKCKLMNVDIWPKIYNEVLRRNFKRRNGVNDIFITKEADHKKLSNNTCILYLLHMEVYGALYNKGLH